MPLYVADYLADTLDLNSEEHGCYMLLLMISWRRKGTLPNDMQFLKRALSACASDMHGNRFNRLVPKLLERFFTLNEQGDFVNKRLGKELEKANKFSENQKENAQKRWAKAKENNNLGDAVAMPARALQSQLHIHSSSLRSEETRARRADALEIEFSNSFWPAWPHKVGKPKALAAFRTARKAHSLETILAGLDRYVRSKPADRPWLNPATFLNQERFNDAPALVLVASGQVPPPASQPPPQRSEAEREAWIAQRLREREEVQRKLGLQG